MRSARSPSAGNAGRSTFGTVQVGKTFFGWWANAETRKATAAIGTRGRRVRLPSQRPLASGEGSS